MFSWALEEYDTIVWAEIKFALIMILLKSYECFFMQRPKLAPLINLTKCKNSYNTTKSAAIANIKPKPNLKSKSLNLKSKT